VRPRFKTWHSGSRPGRNSKPLRGAAWSRCRAGCSLSFLPEQISLGSFAPNHPTVTAVLPAYFRTVGLRIFRGRGFQDADLDRGPAEVVVNETMARLVWRGSDPLGQCMRLHTRDGPCFTVVGVVENARRNEDIEETPAPQYYVPLGNAPAPHLRGTTLLFRAEPRRAAAAAAVMRAELKQAFPSALPSTTPMLEYLEPEYRSWRLGATLFTAFGLLAFVVALVGIYTTVSYGVAQRTHVFGVRLAIGARVGHVVRQIIFEELRTVSAGVLAGIGLALAGGRLVAALLYGGSRTIRKSWCLSRSGSSARPFRRRCCQRGGRCRRTHSQRCRPSDERSQTMVVQPNQSRRFGRCMRMQMAIWIRASSRRIMGR
jgi:MacB-like protein/FtsX-like permease family protein